jgi:hypothetical protein
MDFQLSEEQAGLLGPLERMIREHSEGAAGKTTSYVESDTLSRTLESHGYFDQDLARQLDPLTALLAVEKAAMAPVTLELGNTLFIAPRVSDKPLPRPIAVGDAGGQGVIRHLPGARTLLVEVDGAVRAVDLSGLDIEVSKSLIAYPLGRLRGADLAAAPKLDVTPARFEHLRRLATAAEIIGLMQGALDLTIEYVKVRKQFKRAIGSFQVVRHRLVECEAAVSGARYLTYRAAWTDDPADAELALAHAQIGAARLTYETQQFHGAIGQTLEYPLHLWTFRLRALQGELLGSSVNGALAATHIWGE